MRAQGFIAYLVTPLTADGRRLKLSLIEPYVERLFERCKPGGFACLANDFAYLSDDERRSVAAEVIRCVNGRVPVDVCTSALSTQQAVELAKHAEGVGAAKAIVNPQNYLPLGEAEILRHYETIARALRIPLHVYNNPVATGKDMSVGLLRRIVDATGSRSIKEAGTSAQRFLELHREFGDRIALHVGFHYLALGGFTFGATAWDVGLVPRLAPLCERLYRTAVKKKNLEAATRQFSALRPLFTFFRRKGALRSLKALAAMEGLDLGGMRAPVQPLARRDLSELRVRFERATRREEVSHGH